MKRNRRLTKEEEAEACRRYQSGDDSMMASLVASMEGFVLKQARAYARKNRVPRLAEDLEQEGRIAVLQAAATWQPGKGACLSTWVAYKMQGRFHAFYRGELRAEQKKERLLRDRPAVTTAAQPDPSSDVAEVVHRMANEKHRVALVRAFGLDGPPQTMREQAAEEGVTYQAISGRIAAGLATLRGVLGAAA